MISEELADYINTPNWNCPAFYEDDDEEYTIAITPVLPTEEPDNSLSVGDEHLSTILEMESDELIKSSVEKLVLIPSDDDESFSDEDALKEIYSNPRFDEEIISTKIHSHHFIAKSDLIESLLNQDILIVSSPKFDSLLEEFSGELAHIDLISPEINEADFDPEEGIRLVEKLLYDNSSPRPPNDSPSLPKNESFHFDVPSSPRPPAKPSDDGIYFEPDTGLLTAKVVGDISKHYVLIPRLLTTQPTLCRVIDTLLQFSSENEDKVHLLSHQGFKAFQLFSEIPMMIYGGNIPTLDVPYLHFYPI
ncbi:hypothetical protein Tco_0379496 [Tanacetum coccineum]